MGCSRITSSQGNSPCDRYLRLSWRSVVAKLLLLTLHRVTAVIDAPYNAVVACTISQRMGIRDSIGICHEAAMLKSATCFSDFLHALFLTLASLRFVVASFRLLERKSLNRRRRPIRVRLTWPRATLSLTWPQILIEYL